MEEEKRKEIARRCYRKLKLDINHKKKRVEGQLVLFDEAVPKEIWSSVHPVSYGSLCLNIYDKKGGRKMESGRGLQIEDLANIVFDAVRINQGSYSFDRVKEAENADNRPQIIDYSQFYEVSVKEACAKACKSRGITEDLAQLIYLSLDGWWNDTIEWAEKVLGKKLIVTPT